MHNCVCVHTGFLAWEKSMIIIVMFRNYQHYRKWKIPNLYAEKKLKKWGKPEQLLVQLALDKRSSLCFHRLHAVKIVTLILTCLYLPSNLQKGSSYRKESWKLASQLTHRSRTLRHKTGFTIIGLSIISKITHLQTKYMPEHRLSRSYPRSKSCEITMLSL